MKTRLLPRRLLLYISNNLSVLYSRQEWEINARKGLITNRHGLLTTSSRYYFSVKNNTYSP